MATKRQKENMEIGKAKHDISVFWKHAIKRDENGNVEHCISCDCPLIGDEIDYCTNCWNELNEMYDKMDDYK